MRRILALRHGSHFSPAVKQVYLLFHHGRCCQQWTDRREATPHACNQCHNASAVAAVPAEPGQHGKPGPALPAVSVLFVC